MDKDKAPQRLYSVAELARLLGFSKQTAYNLVYRGIIPSIRPDGTRSIRISEDAIKTYIEKSEVKA